MSADRAIHPPRELLDRLARCERLLLTSHSNPDGDALGTELGLGRLLRALGKQVLIWNRDRHPSLFDTIPGISTIHVGATPPAGFPDSFDAVVVLECPSLERTGLERELRGAALLLNIDHHLGNEQYGAVDWVDVSAPAVGEMAWRLGLELRAPIDAETANALYLALAADTGGFRFSNATPRAFETAAAMVRAGAQPDRAAFVLWEQRPVASMKLLAELLHTIELHDGGSIATAVLTQAMFRRAGAGPQDAEGLIDVPRSIAGVEAVALLREVSDGEFKVSLRSRGELDVASIAQRYQGGGHRNAAGCVARGPAGELRASFASELAAAHRSLVVS